MIKAPPEAEYAVLSHLAQARDMLRFAEEQLQQAERRFEDAKRGLEDRRNALARLETWAKAAGFDTEKTEF